MIFLYELLWNTKLKWPREGTPCLLTKSLSALVWKILGFVSLADSFSVSRWVLVFYYSYSWKKGKMTCLESTFLWGNAIKNKLQFVVSFSHFAKHSFENYILRLKAKTRKQNHPLVCPLYPRTKMKENSKI